MKNSILFVAVCMAANSFTLTAQEGGITNAFDDLKRTGQVSNTFSYKEQYATESQLAALLKEKPAAGYFCFTDTRENDIRSNIQVPIRWLERPVTERSTASLNALPGEFYTWQIGIYTPFQELEGISIRFSDLKNKEGKIISSQLLNCFNLAGTDSRGNSFTNTLSVKQGEVQSLWIGVDIPVEAKGLYKGKVTLSTANAGTTNIDIELQVDGIALTDKGDQDGWRKGRLRWLDSKIGHADMPTAPYTPVSIEKERLIYYLGGNLQLSNTGLPIQIITHYNKANQLDRRIGNNILADKMEFVIVTSQGKEALKPARLRITGNTASTISWESKLTSKQFDVRCTGCFHFDGFVDYKLEVKARSEVQIQDIRLEVPYAAHAAKYMMGLGRKGGYRPDSIIKWNWNVENHQDKVWIGDVNSGLNFCFNDAGYSRPLVNIYYGLGQLNLPSSWGNNNKGGVRIDKEINGEVRMQAYSGERTMHKGETLDYNFQMLITPVKPIDLPKHTRTRFYHSNSDLSDIYIPEAIKAGATHINIHHKKDIYPFINYPYYDESTPDLKQFIDKAHTNNLGVRLYYTTRELTVKLPELWALRSLRGEVIHDGPGKDTRTLIHRNGPHEWLNENLNTNFIPAWYNAFNEGKYAGDMDISVITTPDSRWNNYYLEGLNRMVRNWGLDGVYIDDSALDRKTLQRARRILDADGKERLIDIHSWNHMNEFAGYANSLHIYMELLPYVDRTWIGEGFEAGNTADFWLVEMSGIPFGLMSETLDAKNQFRGMIYGMPPRLPWSGNPVPLWKVWDEFGIEKSDMYGYWDERCPVRSGNEELYTTVFRNGNKAMVVIANWSDLPQKGSFSIDEEKLGFTPTSYLLPEIRNLQWEGKLNHLNNIEIMGRGGMIIVLE